MENRLLYIDPMSTETAFLMCDEKHKIKHRRFLEEVLDKVTEIENSLVMGKPYVVSTTISVKQASTLLEEAGIPPKNIIIIRRKHFPFDKHTMQITF